ncbi:MAG: U32 family peptidase [Patescibacteria group bacterium]
MIKYTLATSWENELIDGIRQLNQNSQKSKIVEIYGSFKISPVGCGRAAFRLPNVSFRQAKRHIKYAHKNGLSFNYTLNAPDFKNKEKNRQWVKKVEEFLTKLEKMEVDTLTIAHPFLIKLVKNKFPNFKINLSLITGINSIGEAKKYEKMGVSLIFLDPFSINRDIKKIKKIAKSIKCEVGLYTNFPCLFNCPNRNARYKFFGYASQEDEEISKITHDPFPIGCSLFYLEHLIEFLKSPFIRPEDVAAYARAGVNKFKLADRSESTASLLNTAEAYMKQQYSGDLFDLIFRKGSKFKAAIKISQPHMAKMKIPISIDNRRLTQLNFLNKIKKLSDKKLNDFYEKATKTAVKFKNQKKIDELKHLFRRAKNRYLIKTSAT